VHAIRSDANLIAVISSRGNDRPNAKSNVSHSPASFIARLGEAYRASGRTRPIFDTFAEHPYAQSSDPPWATHPGTGQISQGDLPRLLEALSGAFAGTGQPAPGSCEGKSCPTVWYLEAGYQTVPAAEKAGLYHDSETEPHPVPDGDGTGKRRNGGRQLRDGVSLAYCQPAVGAFFNFLLIDEPGLAGWQSGVLWADGSPKKSYEAFRAAAKQVSTSSVDCAAVDAMQAAGAEESSSPVALASAGGRRDVVVERAISEAAAYANRAMRLRGLTGLRARRSILDPQWILVVGYHRTGTTSGRLAVWIRVRPGGPRVVKGAYGAAARRRQSDVPCDLSRAFVRPVCLKNETTAFGANAQG
jgi:hypothetical protein